MPVNWTRRRGARRATPLSIYRCNRAAKEPLDGDVLRSAQLVSLYSRLFEPVSSEPNVFLVSVTPRCSFVTPRAYTSGPLSNAGCGWGAGFLRRLECSDIYHSMVESRSRESGHLFFFRTGRGLRLVRGGEFSRRTASWESERGKDVGRRGEVDGNC